MEDTSKKTRLLNSAYNLFKTKGINATTIQDIVDAAKVAKGTFYLYFEDKYHIQEQLIIEQSSILFNNALDELNKHKIKKFDDQIIFIIDYVIDEIIKNPDILKFISKDLSIGVFNDKLNEIIDHENIKDMFIKGVKENRIKLKNPEITLFLIIEFVSSTLYSVVTKRYNIDINVYKTYIHKTIKNLIDNTY